MALVVRTIPFQSLGYSSTTDVALGDVDGDGDLDAYLVDASGGYGHIWLNDGTGHFTDSGQSLDPSSGYAVALGDLNGDATTASAGLTEDETMTISASQLLANDSDVDASDTLTVVAIDDAATMAR